jgi:hypothetical protein
MKNVKKYNDFLNENLEEFFQKMKKDINLRVDMEKTFKLKDLGEIKSIISSNILTDKNIATIASKYGVQVPSIERIRNKNSKTQYHYHIEYILSDSPVIPKREKFNLSIEIEIPLPDNDSIIDENNIMASVSLFIEGKEEFFELFNKKITFDEESNFYKVASLLQNFGKYITENL